MAAMSKLRSLKVSPEHEGIALSKDGEYILCAPEYENIAREWQYNPEFLKQCKSYGHSWQ